MVTLEWMIESVGLPATHVALGSPDAESALLDAPVTDSVVVHGFGDAGDAAIAAATDLLRQRRHVARDGRILVACGSEDLARRPVVLMRDRLEVLELRVPPLRERRADICDALLRFATRPGCLLTHQTADAATRYDWPGGVPELMRVARRLALVQGPIEPFELPEAAAVLALSSPQSVERVRIRESFETHQGNASRVAESLGMSRNHLYRRMRELGLSPESLRLETKKPRAKAPRRAKAGP
jgi:AraC-like DNA-binding protein